MLQYHQSDDSNTSLISTNTHEDFLHLDVILPLGFPLPQGAKDLTGKEEGNVKKSDNTKSSKLISPFPAAMGPVQNNSSFQMEHGT